MSELLFRRREGLEAGWGGWWAGGGGGKTGGIGFPDLHILELPLGGYKTGVD